MKTARKTLQATPEHTPESRTRDAVDPGADQAAQAHPWDRARLHILRVVVAASAAAATWLFVDHVTPGPFAPYLALVTGLAVLSQRYLRAPLGPTTAWALTAVVVAVVFGATDLIAPSFTGCADAYANGCGARSTLDNAAIGLTVVAAAWLVLVPGYLLARGVAKTASRLATRATRASSSKGN